MEVFIITYQEGHNGTWKDSAAIFDNREAAEDWAKTYPKYSISVRAVYSSVEDYLFHSK